MSILVDLIQIRREKKIRQSDICGDIGVTPTTFSKYESGKRRIHLDEAEMYAGRLGYELRLLKK